MIFIYFINVCMFVHVTECAGARVCRSVYDLSCHSSEAFTLFCRDRASPWPGACQVDYTQLARKLQQAPASSSPELTLQVCCQYPCLLCGFSASQQLSPMSCSGLLLICSPFTSCWLVKRNVTDISMLTLYSETSLRLFIILGDFCIIFGVFYA